MDRLIERIKHSPWCDYIDGQMKVDVGEMEMKSELYINRGEEDEM